MKVAQLKWRVLARIVAVLDMTFFLAGLLLLPLGCKYLDNFQNYYNVFRGKHEETLQDSSDSRILQLFVLLGTLVYNSAMILEFFSALGVLVASKKGAKYTKAFQHIRIWIFLIIFLVLLGMVPILEFELPVYVYVAWAAIRILEQIVFCLYLEELEKSAENSGIESTFSKEANANIPV